MSKKKKHSCILWSLIRSNHNKYVCKSFMSFRVSIFTKSRYITAIKKIGTFQTLPFVETNELRNGIYELHAIKVLYIRFHIILYFFYNYRYFFLQKFRLFENDYAKLIKWWSIVQIWQYRYLINNFINCLYLVYLR